MGEKITKMDRQPIISAKGVEITFSHCVARAGAMVLAGPLLDGGRWPSWASPARASPVFTKTFVGCWMSLDRSPAAPIMYEGRDAVGPEGLAGRAAEGRHGRWDDDQPEPAGKSASRSGEHQAPWGLEEARRPRRPPSRCSRGRHPRPNAATSSIRTSSPAVCVSVSSSPSLPPAVRRSSSATSPPPLWT